MAAKKKETKAKKEELVVFCGDNWSLEKDGINIYVKSGTGFFDKERDNADNKLKITIEEI